MPRYKPLVDLQGRLQRGEKGCLQSNNLAVYFNNGSLLQVQSEDDVNWFLRRLVVNGYLSGTEAAKMVGLSTIHGRYFLAVPKEIFQQYSTERAKQNLFRWSHLSQRPSFSTELLDQGPLLDKDAEDLLAEAWVLRDKLSKWYHGIAEMWVYSQSGLGEIASLCRHPILLRKVILQSPLEEVYTLAELDLLYARKQLIVERSAGALMGEETAEEMALFQDYDADIGQGMFQVSQELIEEIAISKNDHSRWSSKDTFEQFLYELNTWLHKLNITAADDGLIHQWLQEEEWSTTVFSQGEWQAELLWRSNYIRKDIFVDILFRWIRLNHLEDWLPQLDTWVSKWA